jgi:demethylmenaquinone methyltransferase/2-methoxy-6-polyprenyl-1,4-benzoquinol methylase
LSIGRNPNPPSPIIINHQLSILANQQSPIANESAICDHKSSFLIVSLRAEIATAEGKRRYVRRLFATIADRYDFITRFLSFGLDRGWKRRLIRLAELRPDDRVLDLACGTGDILFEAAPHVRQAVGLDLTHRMVQLASQRAGRRRGAPSFITGDMLALPFPDGHFTVVTTGYGLRNVPDLDQAVGEIRRVLAPGGRLLSLDFNRPENGIVRGAYWGYLTVVGSALGLALHGDPNTYRYIPESIRNYPGARRVAGLIARHGFVDVRVRPVLGGLMAIHVARASVPAA